MIRRKDKSVTWTVENTKIYFLRELVSSTFLTAVNVKKVWVRLTKKFNLKTSSKKKMGWAHMEQIEQKYYCLHQPSQGGNFLLFPGMQQELHDSEREHQHWDLGPRKDDITRNLPRDSVPSHSHPGASCELWLLHPSHSTDYASPLPPKGIHTHAKSPRITF